MFEWDEAKSVSNRLKHGLSFDEAVAIFSGPVMSLSIDGPPGKEPRTMSIGRVGFILVVAVVHTDRNGRTRIISARPASRRERMLYDDHI